ncbi:MAG: Tad domain-containing protein [Planctomycetaceae bacterium]
MTPALHRQSDLRIAIVRCGRETLRRLRGVHRDQQGTISILSTFAMLMFTILLLLVTNVAMQIDDKVKMQNAADSAAYSGGVVIARGMNAIAFANHLECDVLGITAFLREARDQNAIQFVPTILQRWRDMATQFASASFPKFAPLSTAIPDKANKEEALALAWSDMAKAAADYAVPVFEHILGTPENVQTGMDDHLIPNFQRAILTSIPTLAQQVTNEVALRHGMPSRDRLSTGGPVGDRPTTVAYRRSPQFGVLWRTNVLPVALADETDPNTRTLPVIDPDPSQGDFYRVSNGATLLQSSLTQRRRLATDYLYQWLDDPNLMRGLGFFSEEAKMSALNIDTNPAGESRRASQGLYVITTCAYLTELLDEEYPTTNVPMMLRYEFGGTLTNNAVLDKDYTFIGLAYRAHVREMGPGTDRFPMFRNPLKRSSDAVTFAQVSVFIPRFMYTCCPWATLRRPDPNDPDGPPRWWVHNNGWPTAWNLFNQNWTVKLVPATVATIPEILQASPARFGAAGDGTGLRASSASVGDVKLPNLGGLEMQDLDAINTH